MTREEAIQELQNCIGLIQQDGQDYLDDSDIPLLDMAIEALSEETIEIKPIEIKGDFHIDDIDKNRRSIFEDIVWAVRCKDCKNWRESHSEDDESYCYIDGRTTDSTDFCSWGERKEP